MNAARRLIANRAMRPSRCCVARLIDRNGFERAIFTDRHAPHYETRVLRRPMGFHDGDEPTTTLEVHVARFELRRRDRRGNPVYYEVGA